MANVIQVPGTFDAVAAGKKLADASQIYDGNKKQSEINEDISAEVNEKYTKPSGGIPAEDLSSGVQASLSKADTAIQQHQDISGKADKSTTIAGYGITDAYTKNQVDAAIADIDVTEQLGDYAKKTEVTSAVAAETARAQGVEATKANASDVTTALAGKADKTEVTAALAGKANTTDVATSLAAKQDTISDLATIRSGAALGATAKQPATTIAGYGITDAYTKSETYTKTEVNGLVDTPHQEYVTVDAYADLPVTGSKDTIYRLSNYNGSTNQVDTSVYSEYAWNGTQYILLCVKSQIGEVFDISVYNNNARYANLAEALNGGANIPQSLQKGGMSIKFIQITTPATYTVVRDDDVEDPPAGTDIQEDWAITSGTYTAAQLSGKTLPTTVGNSIMYYTFVEATVEVPEHYTTWEITKATNDSTKYVQLRYMGTSTAAADFTNTANWQGVDDKPTAGSDNYVKSGGIYNALYYGLTWKEYKDYDGTLAANAVGEAGSGKYKAIPIKKGDVLYVKAASSNGCYFVVVNKIPTNPGETYSKAQGENRVIVYNSSPVTKTITADDAAAVLVEVERVESSVTRSTTPAILKINDDDIMISYDITRLGVIVPVYTGYITITNTQITIPNGSRMIVGKKYKQVVGDKTIAYNTNSQSSIVVYNEASEQFTAIATSDYIYTKGDYILFSIGYSKRLCSLPFSYYRFNDESPLKEDVTGIVNDVVGSKGYAYYAAFGWTKGVYIDHQAKITSNANWAITRKIPCAEGDVLRWKAGAAENSIYISLVIFNEAGVKLSYISVGAYTQERTITCPENAAYIIASFYMPNANGYLYINDVLTISLSAGIVSQFDVNGILQERILEKASKVANIASTGNTKINITDTTITIPGYLRIVYGGGNVYRVPNGGVELQRTVPTGSSGQSEYVLFDASDNSIKTVEEANITQAIIKPDVYILFSVSNGLSGCSLSFSQYTINGSPAVESNKYNATDIVTQNKHKESALMATLLYKGNTDFKVDNKVSLLFFTDVHGNTANIKRVIEYGNKYAAYLDDVIHGGDSVQFTINDPNPFENVTGGQNILNVAGNHEAWLSGSDTDYLGTEKQVYDKIFANCVANWDVVQPANAATNGYCYYYKDYRNMRLIVLDNIHWHKGGNQQIVDDYAAQKTWFEGVLADAITNNKIVICAMHYPSRYITPLANVKGFNSYGTTDNTDIADGWYADDLIFDCVDTFIDNGGKFMGWMMGHTHTDYIGYIKNHANQAVVIAGTAGASNSKNKNVVGTNSQDNFNIITFSWIDNSTKLIKILRVGNDMDMYGRSKKSISFNIVDGTVLEVE